MATDALEDIPKISERIDMEPFALGDEAVEVPAVQILFVSHGLALRNRAGLSPPSLPSSFC
jgi:hypothetical protein